MTLQTTYDNVEDSDVCVLCLPSPVDEDGKPVTKYLEDAVSDIAKRMNPIRQTSFSQNISTTV